MELHQGRSQKGACSPNLLLLRTSGVARSASGGTRPGAQPLGTHQHIFWSILKTRFKQKYKPSMLKNA